MSERARKLLRRTLVGGGLAAALALLVLLADRLGDGLVFWLGWALAALGARELALLGVPGWRGVGPLFALPLVVLALVRLSGFAAAPALDLVLAGGATLGATMLPRWRAGPRPVPRWDLAAAAAWVALPLPWLADVHLGWGTGGLVALLVLSKVGDVAGYYAGSAFGRSRPFPRISPGKTTEGCVASLVAGTAAGALCVAAGLLPGERVGAGLLAGAGLNLAAQGGDLLESWLKRRAGVKDSGSWFGPSGGVLDLVDSLLLTVPAALVLWPALFERAG